MPESTPHTAVNITETWDDNSLARGNPANVIPWQQVRDRIASADEYWVATVRASGAPHVRPVLAVWVNGRWYSSTNETRAKARHLRANPQVAVTTHVEGVDVVIEGRAEFVTGQATLEQVAQAYRSKYGWPLEIRNGQAYAPFGAPTAGPPPFRPYAVTPEVVYALGVTDQLGPRSTKYTF